MGMNTVAQCPCCTAKLLNVVAKPIPADRQRVSPPTHALGGTYVHSVETHEVIGECPKHGIVRTTIREQRV